MFYSCHGTKLRDYGFTAAGEIMPGSWLFESQVNVSAVTEPSLLWFRFFGVRSLNSFERVPLPRVTENPYGANNKQRGWRCEGRNLVTSIIIRIVNY